MEPPGDEARDPTLFERLVRDYADQIYRITLRITHSAQDAEDATQDAFLNAFEHLATFRGEASIKTWLYRIAVNEALRRTRQRRPVEYLADDGYETEHIADWSVDLGRAVEESELRDMLDRALARLPEDQRAAVILRDVEGLSAADAAQILETSAAALKSRLHRGRVLLRQFLSGYLQAS